MAVERKQQVKRNNRKRYYQSKEKGICVHCYKNIAIKGMVLCESCRYEVKDTYHYYKSLGICTVCKKEDAVGGVCCPDCADLQAQWHTDIITKMAKNTDVLIAYRKEKSDKYKQWRLKKRKLGLCEVCGKKPVEKGKYRCYECLIKKRREGLKRRNPIPRSARVSFGMCFICGEPVMKNQKVCIKHYHKFGEKWGRNC